MAVLSDAQREAGWTIVKLGDIAPLAYGKSLVASKRIPGDIPVYSSAGLIDSHNEAIIDGQNIIIGRKGTIGSITWSEGPAYPIDTTFYTAGTDKTNIKYLYYLLKTYKFSAMNTDSAVPGLNRVTFESQEAVLPPLDEQERIAGILGSLDDKIEANTRLIQTLLDTADSIFQKFYSECELSESTYASLEVYGGGTPSTKNETYWGGDIHWLTPTDVTSLGSPMLFDTARKLTEDGLNACSSKLHPAGSIMMTSRATIGAFAINQYPAATNQGFIVAVPQREEERWWIYHHMKKDVPEMINSANGTTFLEISRRTFKGLPYGSLSDENLDRFHAVVNPLYELVKSSEQENLQLAAIRDALIKRLIG